MSKFNATTITRTGTVADALEITLSDAKGRVTTVRLPAHVARGLARVMDDFAAAGSDGPAPMVKRPKAFAVGTGRHEKTVLLRFNDEVPYGVTPELAVELANALLEACGTTEGMPATVLQ